MNLLENSPKDGSSALGMEHSITEMHGLILAIQESVEFSETVSFLNTIDGEKYLNLLYVTLIPSYIHIQKTLVTKPLPSKNVYVADCVSKLLVENLKDTSDVIFRTPPRTSEEMKRLLLDAFTFANPQIIILDSLTQFLNYSNLKERELRDFFDFLEIFISDKKFGIVNKIILLYNEKLSSNFPLDWIEKNCKNIGTVYINAK